MVQPIHLWSHAGGPNPWKVAILLEELGVPYETEIMDMSVLHTPVYEKYNPNGRVPAIHDPNTNITLWESGAIIEYLIETYDKDHKLSFPASTPEKYHTIQWLYYQGTGQGPYFGQAVWFTRFHPEQVQSAKDRYYNEVRRVTKVLDKWLDGKQWLVGDKCTFADLAFIPWANLIGDLLKDLSDDNPNYAAWLKRMNERSAVSKVWKARADAMAKGH